MKHYLRFVIALVSLCVVHAHSQTITPALWGMASNGGAYGLGDIFKCTFSGAVMDMYDFGNGADGNTPRGSLIQATNGLLYGLTWSGGTNDLGTLFSYDITSGKETVLHNFAGDTDGEAPRGSLLQASNGVLYGTTPIGGTHSEGTIFSYTISTSQYNVVYNFNTGTDGQSPQGSLVQVGDSLLYGTTNDGGTNDVGTVYSFNIYTNQEKVLHSFKTHPYESAPSGSLVVANNGLLYGMADGGGTNNAGVIYSFNIATDSVTDVYNFANNGTDAYNPVSSLMQAGNGMLYGMTVGGGTYSLGAILSFNDTTEQEMVVTSFGRRNNHTTTGPDGVNPYGSLIQASNGLLYGTTETGGVNNEGVIFSYAIGADTDVTVHSFTDTDGAAPYGNLLEVDSVYTGINRLSVNNNQLSVYPNPSSDFIYVNLTQPQMQPVQLSLYNILGQEVYTTLTLSSSNPNLAATIPVTGLAEGVYVLRVNGGGSFQQREIVVAR